MAEQAAPSFKKGDRIQITKGPAEGVAGTVFWKGQNKYGPGDRYGVRGDDGQTHWVDSEMVAKTDAAVPEGPSFDRGDRVKFRDRQREGTGTVFWTGQNKHGPGQRIGVNPDDAEGRDDAVWLDARAARPLPPEEDPQGAGGPGGDDPYAEQGGGYGGGGGGAYGGGYGGGGYGGGNRGGGGSHGGGGGNRGGGGGGWQDDGPTEIPAEYQGNVSLDDMPPSAPWDDGAADAMAAGADAEDEGPPLEW